MQVTLRVFLQCLCCFGKIVFQAEDARGRDMSGGFGRYELRYSFIIRWFHLDLRGQRRCFLTKKMFSYFENRFLLSYYER